jgi:hypothetical protein
MQTTQVSAAVMAAPIRYGLLPNAASYAPLDELQSARVDVSTLAEGSDPAAYDVTVGYGTINGWQAVPVSLEPVSLVFDTSRPPFNEAALVDVVHEAVDVQQVLAEMQIDGVEALVSRAETANSRLALARSGFPDGISLYGQVDNLPGAMMVIQQLGAANIDVQVVDSADAHLRVARLSQTERSELTPEQVVDLYKLPMSYTANENLLVTFMDDGWVIAARSN